jgi:hypothetical protein
VTTFAELRNTCPQYAATIATALVEARHDLKQHEYALLLATVSSYCSAELGKLATPRKPCYEGDDPNSPPAW